MKNYIYFLLLLVVIALTSCDEVGEGENGITGFQEVYHYEMAEPIVSADSHEFTLSMTGDYQPKSWEVWDFKLRSDSEIPNPLSTHTEGWKDAWMSSDYFEGKNDFGVEWISFERIHTSTSPKLKVTIKENNTNFARSAFMVYGDSKPPKGGGQVKSGILIITQKPKPD